jgi:subtilase family serine protease
VPGSNDPGVNEDLGEADLDLEWPGALAPNATIFYMYADDVITSSFFAIDEAPAPVLSLSYGGCELKIPQSDARALAAEAEKAAAQGIIWVVSSGDAGAAGCESQGANYTAANTRMSVNLPASLPFVTAVGGDGLGHINPKLYQLAQTAPSSFHDVTTGSNIVPCVTRSTQDCRNGYMGYTAHAGYDQVTGLGSVNAYNLARAWRSASAKSAHLVVTKLEASTTVGAGNPFQIAFDVTNQGAADAGEFEMRVYLTKNGDVATANSWYLYCTVSGLSAGKTTSCSGPVKLGQSVTPGTYFVLGVADAKNSVEQTDRTDGTMLASTGPLTVTK